VPDDETPDKADDEAATPPGAGGDYAGDGATAPGLAVGEGHGALDEAPEPNEPA
jgi:hypothetical protein